MLLSKEVEVTLNYKNIKRYLDFGYEFPTFINKDGNVSVKRGTKLKVKIIHLDVKSGSVIKYKCDYCGKEIEVRYCDYMKHYQDGNKNESDCCINCISKKTQSKLIDKYGVNTPFALKEVRDKRDKTVKDKYGVDNVFQLKDVQNKSRDTNLEKYGKEWYTQTDEYKIRAKETCLDKYGYDNVSKSPEIIEKIKDVQFERYGNYYSATDEGKERYKNYCMNNYGVENLFQADFVKDKILEYNYNTYGVSHPMKLDNIKEERFKKMVVTKYRNGSGQSSRQQDYLHKVYGGEVNYPVDRCSLDIAYVNEKIYFEYDGSGHDLSVVMGDYTRDEFNRREMNRKFYLFSCGWKEIRIISKKDYLPSEEILLKMRDFSLRWFNQNHKWIKFYIDEGKYETSEGFDNYNFEKLRKINEEDLESAI